MTSPWETRQLGAVSAINYGYTESASTEQVGPRFLRITDIQNGHVDWDKVPYCKIEQAEVSRYRLASGDIVFARTGATTGKSFLIRNPPEAVFASYLIRLRLTDKALLPEFLYKFFQTGTYWKLVEEGLSGSAQGGFNATKLGALAVPVPPHTEQQRIVHILDKAFDSIATAKANVEKNLQNCRALFESFAESVFDRSSEAWTPTILGDEVDLLSGFPFKSISYTAAADDTKLLRGDNIIQESIRWQDVKRWPGPETSAYERFLLQSGDVVLAMDRPWVNNGLKRAMITPNDLPCLLVQRTARLRARSDLDQRFLAYLLGTSKFLRHILGVQTGIGVPHISGQQIRDFKFRKPPILTQRSVADNLDKLKAQTKRLSCLYRQKLLALEELKQSLLHQAFSGAL